MTVCLLEVFKFAKFVPKFPGYGTVGAVPFNQRFYTPNLIFFEMLVTRNPNPESY